VKQIFTFCGNHENKNGYVVVHGKDYGDCRAKMIESFGTAWGFQYDSEESAGVYRFNLELVATLGTVDQQRCKN
jgi:hypothetical protein